MKQSLLPLICIALIAGCGTNPKEKTSASADHMQHRIERNEVTVDTLRRRDFVRELISNGRLIAAKRSTLSFPVTGTIVAIHAGNGEGVNRGAVIARIDTTEYAVQLHKSQLALDKSRLEFYDVLVGLGYPVGDTINVPVEALRLARIRSGYADALASLQSARRNLEQCSLCAPFSGKVANVQQHLYENAKGEFCTLLDDRRLNVRFTVLESEYGQLRRGQESSEPILSFPKVTVITS